MQQVEHRNISDTEGGRSVHSCITDYFSKDVTSIIDAGTRNEVMSDQHKQSRRKGNTTRRNRRQGKTFC